MKKITKTKSTKSATLSKKYQGLVRLVCEEKQLRVDYLAKLLKYSRADVLRDVLRLEELGFLETHEVLAKEKGLLWVMPTREGLRQVGFGGEAYRSHPSLKYLNHTFLAAATRVHYSSQLRGWEWISERCSSKEKGRVEQHLPDAVLRRGKKTIAIEIEVTPKKNSELKGIITKLSKEHTKVNYHCSSRARAGIEKAVKALAVDNVAVFDLPAEPIWFPERKQKRDE